MPANDGGELIGRCEVFCKNYKDMTNSYKFASRIIDNEWFIEFAPPLDKILPSNNRFLFYQHKFKNSRLPQGGSSYYPVPTKGTGLFNIPYFKVKI